MNICENINYPPPKKSTFHLPSDLINAIMTAHDSFCAQDVPVVGFMSGGMVIDTVSEGFCNYLHIRPQMCPKGESNDDWHDI